MNDEQFMRRALALAEQGRYSVSPNPMVGCVIVRDGAIVAEGFHERAGEPHAEIVALRNVAQWSAAALGGATMYITLEPCSHQGRTGPCAEAVARSGVARVVIAMQDPNELVDGRGIATLREAGIEVTTGVLEAEARRLNEKFLWSMTHKLPFVLIKAALTLDGKLATITRESQWITAEAAREKSLALREEYDAILVGSGTITADNPRLTRRLGLAKGITPWTRVVLDGDGEVSPHAQIFGDGGRTILFTSKPQQHNAAEVIPLDGRADLESLFRALHERGIQSVIVEGGALLHSEIIRRGLWQKMIVFIAPLVVGGADAPAILSGAGVARLTEGYRFRFDRAEFVGGDLMVTAYPS